jgi:flagellar hook-associated protein FlgK
MKISSVISHAAILAVGIVVGAVVSNISSINASRESALNLDRACTQAQERADASQKMCDKLRENLTAKNAELDRQIKRANDLQSSLDWVNKELSKSQKEAKDANDLAKVSFLGALLMGLH